MIALFIGRFQPFHLGHLSALRDISDAGAKEIIIAIGSAQYSGTAENPYDFATRKMMINNALSAEKFRYRIVSVPDIHDYPRWVDHVIKTTGIVDVVYTGNSVVKELFEAKNYLVRPLEIKINISGTKLRQLIADKKQWENYVPPGVARIIKLGQLSF